MATLLDVAVAAPCVSVTSVLDALTVSPAVGTRSTSTVKVPDGAVVSTAPSAGLTTTAVGDVTAAITTEAARGAAPVAHVPGTARLTVPAWKALSEPNVKLQRVPVRCVAAMDVAVVEPCVSVTRSSAGSSSVAPNAGTNSTTTANVEPGA